MPGLVKVGVLCGRRVSCVVKFGLVLCAVPAQGWAQEVPLPPIQIFGRQVETEGSDLYAGQVSTVGSKTANALKDTPRSITVFTRRRLDDENVTTVAQAAERTTGVYVNENDSNDGPFFYSRGFLMSVSENGVPMDTVYYRQGFDTSIYDRIEVLRGPNGLFDGQGQAGGTVNLVHKRPLSQPRFQTELSTGQWNNYRGVFDLSAPLNPAKTVRGRFVLAAESKDSWVSFAGQEKLLGYGVIEADITDSTMLTLRMLRQRSDVVPYFGGVTYFNSTNWTPRNQYGGASWNTFQYDRTEGTIKFDQRLGENWVLSATGTYRVYDDFKRVAFHNPLLNAAGQSTLTNRANWFEGDHLTADIHLRGQFRLLNRTHQLTVGANGEKFDFQTWVRNAASVGFWQFGNPNVPYQALDKTGATWRDFDVRQTGVYAQTRLELLSNLHLHLGGRLNRYFYDQQVLSTPGSTRTTSYNESGVFTPYGGLVLALNQNVSVYVSYADIFRPQFTTDLDASGGMLPPIVGRQYEAGIKANLFDDFDATFSVFDILDTNRPLSDPGNPGSYIPAGEVRSRGFEVEVAGKLLPNWQIISGYTYTDAEFLSASPALVGTTFNGFIPKHSFKAWSNYTVRHAGFFDGVEIGLGVRAFSKNSTTQGALIFEQPAYAVVDARLGYKVNENVSLSLNVSNLFDTTYVPYPFPRAVYGEPRRATLKFVGRW